MTTIFLTGASGFIGGDVLHAMSMSMKDVKIRALVRDQTKAKCIQASFPDVTIVLGTLDNAETIEKEARYADIIVQLADTKHLEATRAIHSGLSKKQLGYWIQISGATAISQAEIIEKRFGEPSNEISDDLEGIDDLIELITSSPQRAVDNYIIDVALSTPHVKTALIFGPIIYGKGRGPVNQRSIQIPELSRIALERGRAVTIGRGLNRWGNVHVADLSDLMLRLIRYAIVRNSNEQVWGRQGLYLVDVDQEMTFGEISHEIASAAHHQQLIDNSEVESISAEMADKLSNHASATMGTNARVSARRAREVLDWTPCHVDLPNEIVRCVASEATGRASAFR